MVRINSLYTQTINFSMDLPAPSKGQPASLDLLGSIQPLKHTNVLGVLFCFVCYSEKSFLENSQSGSTLSSAQHLSPLASECQSEIKKPNRGGFEQCHGGRGDFQLSVRGPGLLCAVTHTHTHCLYRLPEPMQGPHLQGQAWLGAGQPWKGKHQGLGSFQSGSVPLRPDVH